MSNVRSIGDGDRYQVTPAGREAAEYPESCLCIIVRDGDVFQCKLCGTVWKPSRTTFGGSGRDKKHD